MKKMGVSLVVSYTLLVVIAVALSILVYGFLRQAIPPEIPECPPEVHIGIENPTCTGFPDSVLVLDVVNRGLFNVDGAYIRLGESGRIVRDQINIAGIAFNSPLPPGDRRLKSYEICPPGASGQCIVEITQGAEYVLEVQPVIFEQGTPVACETIVTETIICN